MSDSRFLFQSSQIQTLDSDLFWSRSEPIEMSNLSDVPSPKTNESMSNAGKEDQRSLESDTMISTRRHANFPISCLRD